MSNENPNNTPRWRDKLDELDHLPGSSFNSHTAWDKLHGRLRGTKKSKKIAWYWMAAACLLFGLMITLLNHKNTAERANKETAIKQEKKLNQPSLTTEEANTDKNESGTELINDKIVPVPNKAAQRKRRVVATEIATKVQTNDVATNYPEQPFAKPLRITNNPTTASVPPKKKLNVVHINEMGDPVIEFPDITRIEDIHSFKLKFGNGEVFSNSPTVSRPSGFIILKTKAASN
jgi:hypothetical protein